MSANVSILFLQESYGLRQPGLLRLLSPGGDKCGRNRDSGGGCLTPVRDPTPEGKEQWGARGWRGLSPWNLLHSPESS